MSNSPKIIKKAKAKDVCKCDYCEKVLEIGEEHSVAIYEVQKQTYHWRTCARCKSYVKEAQQNKTSMRLRRDSQGNYSYQFIADEDAVGKAEDELATEQNELYNFDKISIQSENL